MHSHDEPFDAKAHIIRQLYAKALESYKHGCLVICCDEKTGMQGLERKAPTKPAQAGRRERREHEYIRHGTRVLINSLAVQQFPVSRMVYPAYSPLMPPT